jgi:hypothetical protein
MFLPPGYKYFLKFEEDSSVLMHKSLTYWNAFDPAYCAICNHEGLGKVQQIHKWTMMDLVMDREWWDLWRSTLNELHSGYMNDEFTWETPGVEGAGGGGRAEAWTIREGCRLKGSALERRRGSNLRSGTNMMLQLETQRQRRKLVPQGDPGAKRARFTSYCKGAMGPTGYQLSKWGQRPQEKKWPVPQPRSKIRKADRIPVDTEGLEEPPVPKGAQTKGARKARAGRGKKLPEPEVEDLPPPEPSLQPPSQPPQAEPPQVEPSAPPAASGRLTRAQAKKREVVKSPKPPAGPAPGNVIITLIPPLSADLAGEDLPRDLPTAEVPSPLPPAPKVLTQQELQQRRETRRKRQHPLSQGYKRQSLAPPLSERERRMLEQGKKLGEDTLEMEEEEHWFDFGGPEEEDVDETVEITKVVDKDTELEREGGKPQAGKRREVIMEEEESEGEVDAAAKKKAAEKAAADKAATERAAEAKAAADKAAADKAAAAKAADRAAADKATSDKAAADKAAADKAAAAKAAADKAAAAKAAADKAAAAKAAADKAAAAKAAADKAAADKEKREAAAKAAEDRRLSAERAAAEKAEADRAAAERDAELKKLAAEKEAADKAAAAKLAAMDATKKAAATPQGKILQLCFATFHELSQA